MPDRVESDAERAAEQQYVREHGHPYRVEYTQVEAGVAGQERKVSVLGQALRLLDSDLALLDQQILEQKAQELGSDDVQHDRAENLRHAGVRLQRTGDRSPDPTPERAGEQHDRHEDDARSVGDRQGRPTST